MNIFKKRAKEKARKNKLAIYRRLDSKGIMLVWLSGEYGIEVKGIQLDETFVNEEQAFERAFEIENTI